MANDGREGEGFYSFNVAGNSTYPNIQNSNMMLQGQWQDQDQGRVPYGYNQAWYPRSPSNVFYLQPDYTYPNPAPSMDMNMNMTGYNGGYYFNEPSIPYGSYYGYYDEHTGNYIRNNYYYHAPTDGFYPLQPQPQLQVQPQQVIDAGRRGSSGRQFSGRNSTTLLAGRRGISSSSRHSSGRNSNTLQETGRGRGKERGSGRVLWGNNYNDNTSLPQVMGNIGELLMRMRISEGGKSTQLQYQGHAEPYEHANADAVSREYWNAKFFVIKSCSMENVVSSIRHRVWTSTRKGNRILNAAYSEGRHQQSANASCHVFLFFSVKGSGNFCGVAEMDGPVDFEAFADCWNRDWKGKFPVKWHTIKDVPYSQFQHITFNTVENLNQISIVYSRDTQQVEFEKGLEMLDIFNKYVSTTSLLDDVSMSTGSLQQQQQSPPPSPHLQHQEQPDEKETQQTHVGTNQPLIKAVDTDETTQNTKIDEDSLCDCIDQTQQNHLDTCKQPPKTTVDTDETTQEIKFNVDTRKQPPLKTTVDTDETTQEIKFNVDTTGDTDEKEQTYVDTNHQPPKTIVTEEWNG